MISCSRLLLHELYAFILIFYSIVTVVSSYSWTKELPDGNASIEYSLKKRLLRGYDVTSRPVRADSQPVKVKVGISLFHILDTSERHQTVSALLSIRVHWHEQYLNWNQTEFPIKKFWIPSRSIWRPDLVITNYANDEYSDYMNTNAIVAHNGNVMWTFPIVVKMYCTLDVRYFPFDTQDCTMTFTSWTYNGYQLSLNHSGANNQKVYFNPTNQEWMVTHITPNRQVKQYPCCDEPFHELHFTIHMYRRSLFYIVNLICPCILIYLVSFLGFYLPIESGEKVNLEITVLLALVVFLLMVSETMPPTPDAIPILGLMFAVTMVMVALAVVMAVTVTRVYFGQPQETPPAAALRLSRLWRRWRRVSPRRQRAAAARGFAGLRRVQLQATDASDENIATAALQQLPPSASYFKEALLCANGCIRDEADDDGKSSVEHWRCAAFALDRIFFWIFTMLTLIAFAAVCLLAAPAFEAQKQHMTHH